MAWHQSVSCIQSICCKQDTKILTVTWGSNSFPTLREQYIVFWWGTMASDQEVQTLINTASFKVSNCFSVTWRSLPEDTRRTTSSTFCRLFGSAGMLLSLWPTATQIQINSGTYSMLRLMVSRMSKRAERKEFFSQDVIPQLHELYTVLKTTMSV